MNKTLRGVLCLTLLILVASAGVAWGQSLDGHALTRGVPGLLGVHVAGLNVELAWTGPDSSDLELALDGVPVDDLVIARLEDGSLELRGWFEDGRPDLVGGLRETENGDLLQLDIDWPYSLRLIFNRSNRLVSAATCLCTRPNGGLPSAICTNAQCDSLDSCSNSRYCNWRCQSTTSLSDGAVTPCEVSPSLAVQ